MVVHAYYPIGEPRVQREAEALADVSYEVDVICLRQPGELARDLVHGINVYRLPVRRHKSRGVLVQLLEYLAFFCLACWWLTTWHFRRRYNAVQVHNPPDFLVFATLVPRLMGAKVILDLHDLMPEFYASRFKCAMDSWPVRLVHWQERLASRFASHVITVTDPWRQTLIQRGLPPDKCSVVMNVADSKIFRRDRVNVHPSQDGRFRLIYHGNIAQRYGLDLALRAVARLRHDLPDIHLTIHGRGAFLDDLRRLAQELELGEHVRFSTEYMPIEELPALIASADLGLIPYRRDVFTDGILPTKLMEYTALGVPAVAAHTSAIKAYFDETMVQFFTPGDPDDLARCIRELYHDRVRLATLAKNVEQFNQCYNWTIQSTKYVRLVDQLRSNERQANKPS
jgi:glycosyltransferase involved in cell wall biosynthesis